MNPLIVTLASGLIGAFGSPGHLENHPDAAPARSTMVAVPIIMSIDTPRTINRTAMIVALVRTDRDRRSWKTLKLKPGNITRYYYDWLLEDGSTVRKVETIPIAGVPDDRPYKQKHPDIDIAWRTLQQLWGPLTAGMVSAKP